MLYCSISLVCISLHLQICRSQCKLCTSISSETCLLMPGSPHPLWERWRCIQLSVVLNRLRCWLEVFESLVFGFVWSLWTPLPLVKTLFVFHIEVSSKTWNPLRLYLSKLKNDVEWWRTLCLNTCCLMKTLWRVREEYEDLIHRFFFQKVNIRRKKSLHSQDPHVFLFSRPW